MRKSINKKYVRMICAILAILFSILSIPLNVFAAMDIGKEVIDTEVIGEFVEVVDRREENVKHFRKPDGTYTAVSYFGGVHRRDKNGEWQDIDNTLSLPNTRSKNIYSTKDNRVSFSRNFVAGKQLFSLSEEDHIIAVTLLQKNDTLNTNIRTKYVNVRASGVTNAPVRAKSWNTIEEAAKIDNSSRILYENVRNGMNIEYILDGNDVKENIIIKHIQSDYSYDFQIELIGLDATICDDGSIAIYDTTSKETKYTIPAPYMYDECGNISYDVSYALNKVSVGKYILSVTANKEWINASKRAFPVVIDPTIVKNDAIYDTYVDTSVEANSAEDINHGASDNLIVSEDCTAFIKFDLPELPEGAQPNRVQLKLSYYFEEPCANQYIDVEILRVDTFWRSGALKYATYDSIKFEQYDDCVIRVSGTGSTSALVNYSAFFDITAFARDWYAGVSNEGLAFKCGDGGAIKQIYIKSCETASPAHKPHLYVDYSNAFNDGIYVFKNIGNYGMFMDTRDNSYQAGAYMQKTYLGNVSSSDITDNSMKFKITRVEETDSYIIRLMTNNSLTFAVTNAGDIQTKEITPYDDNVQYGDTYVIAYEEDGYVIKPYSSPQMISVWSGNYSGDDGGILAKLTTTNTLSENAKWEILPCSITNHTTTGFVYAESDIVAGESVRFVPVISSTKIGYNVPRLELNSAGSSIASLVSTTTLGKATYKIHYDGEFSVYMYLYGDNDSLDYTYGHEQPFEAILPFEEGKYAIQNSATNAYLGAAGHEMDYTVAFSNLYNADTQIWTISHVVDKYYKISLSTYNICLTAPDIPYGDLAVEEVLSNPEDNQLWVINDDTNMFYSKGMCSQGIFSPAVNADDVIQNVYCRSYTDDSDLSDEWNFIKLLPTSGSELDYDESLWNYSPVQENTNCYAYAIDNQVDLQGNFYRQNPGRYADAEIGSGFYVIYDNWYRNMREDFEDFGIDTGREMMCIEIDQYTQCHPGTYKIALVLDITSDTKGYHYYRQDSDGLWSHKPDGALPIKRTDYSGNLIIDPQTADRGKYTEFVGYFAITPLRNYYHNYSHD